MVVQQSCPTAQMTAQQAAAQSLSNLSWARKNEAHSPVVHVATEHHHQQHVEPNCLCYAGQLWAGEGDGVAVDPAVDQIATKQAKQRTWDGQTRI